VRIGIPIADMLAPVFTVIGILAAIEQRHRTGEGQHVDVSMLGALTSFVAIENWSAMAAAGMEARTGLTVQRLSPFGVFECADGYVAVVAVHEPLARGLFAAMGEPDLARTPASATATPASPTPKCWKPASTPGAALCRWPRLWPRWRHAVSPSPRYAIRKTRWSTPSRRAPRNHGGGAPHLWLDGRSAHLGRADPVFGGHHRL
jgi:hypothetical protein